MAAPTCPQVKTTWLTENCPARTSWRPPKISPMSVPTRPPASGGMKSANSLLWLLSKVPHERWREASLRQRRRPLLEVLALHPLLVLDGLLDVAVLLAAASASAWSSVSTFDPARRRLRRPAAACAARSLRPPVPRRHGGRQPQRGRRLAGLLRKHRLRAADEDGARHHGAHRRGRLLLCAPPRTARPRCRRGSCRRPARRSA